jgi:predicted nucleic acid-binding protein
LKLFIDTWGWLTLLDKRESRHQEVVGYYRDFRFQQGLAYTSDYVLDETITLLFRRLPFTIARESLEGIKQAIAEGYLVLVSITPEQFELAIQLRLKFQDKPRISFTDFVSMVMMRERDIEHILTEDDHFTQVGMAFQKVP